MGSHLGSLSCRRCPVGLNSCPILPCREWTSLLVFWSSCQRISFLSYKKHSVRLLQDCDVLQSKSDLSRCFFSCAHPGLKGRDLFMSFTSPFPKHLAVVLFHWFCSVSFLPLNSFTLYHWSQILLPSLLIVLYPGKVTDWNFSSLSRYLWFHELTKWITYYTLLINAIPHSSLVSQSLSSHSHFSVNLIHG